MMSRQVQFILLAVLTLTTGCLKTRGDVREAEVQSQTVEQQRMSANRVMDLEEDFRSLSGRLEVLERNMKEQGDTNSRNSKERKEEIDFKLNAYKEAIDKLQQQIIQLTAEVEVLKSRPQVVPPKSKEITPIKSSEKAIKKNSFDTAEEHFAKKDWKNAILHLQKYREEFPKGKKGSKATYLIGVCFQELGMFDEARAFYEEVMSKYPKSEEAVRAKNRIKKLK